MSWDWRVVRREHENGEATFGVYEAYYDAEGRVWAVTAEPVEAQGETLQELKDELWEQLKALIEPILNYDDIPEPGAVNPADGIDWDEVEAMS